MPGNTCAHMYVLMYFFVGRVWLWIRSAASAHVLRHECERQSWLQVQGAPRRQREWVWTRCHVSGKNITCNYASAHYVCRCWRADHGRSVESRWSWSFRTMWAYLSNVFPNSTLFVWYVSARCWTFTFELCLSQGVHRGRKLTWMWKMSTAEVKTNHLKKPYQLTCSALQVNT